MKIDVRSATGRNHFRESIRCIPLLLCMQSPEHLSNASYFNELVFIYSSRTFFHEFFPYFHSTSSGAFCISSNYDFMCTKSKQEKKKHKDRMNWEYWIVLAIDFVCLFFFLSVLLIHFFRALYYCFVLSEYSCLLCLPLVLCVSSVKIPHQCSFIQWISFLMLLFCFVLQNLTKVFG